MDDRIDLGGLNDALQNAVSLFGAHKLGALQRQTRVVGVNPDDHFNFVDLFEHPGDVSTPKGAEAGDENSHWMLLSEPHALALRQHVVERVLDAAAYPF